MRSLLDAIERSLKDKNWFAALFITLCLPDICGSLETSNGGVAKRYQRWFNENLSEKYLPLFSAEDCYYFRCSCLHQGLDKHKDMKHERIHFIPPPPRGNIVHLNKLNNVLQMQIDIFCIDMAIAVNNWLEKNKDNENIKDGLAQLIKIYPIESLEPFIKFR